MLNFYPTGQGRKLFWPECKKTPKPTMFTSKNVAGPAKVVWGGAKIVLSQSQQEQAEPQWCYSASGTHLGILGRQSSMCVKPNGLAWYSAPGLGYIPNSYTGSSVCAVQVLEQGWPN